MGMIFADNSEYFGEYIRDTACIRNRLTTRLKKAWRLMANFHALLWIILFLMLTGLINILGS